MANKFDFALIFFTFQKYFQSILLLSFNKNDGKLQKLIELNIREKND